VFIVALLYSRNFLEPPRAHHLL